MKFVVVVMVGPGNNGAAYNWFTVFAPRGGEGPREVTLRAEAWGREKAGGTDRVWTETSEVHS